MKAQTARLYKHVEMLTGLNPARSYEHPASLEKAAGYISESFQQSGMKTEIQHWNAQHKPYKNIIASYHGDATKRLIIGAHYDVCGDQPGADDNASGVAGLLEIGHMLSENKPQTDYAIDLVAYCLEEPPYFGSESMGSFIHAKSLHDKKLNLMGMISLEMIGYFSDKPESQPFPSPDLAKIYPHTANFIIVVGIKKHEAFNTKVYKLMAEGSGIDVQVISFPEGDGLAGLSDQRSYWKFGYPALMINDTSFIRNPNYHRKTDTVDTLDFKKMSEVVNSVYRAITNFK